MNDRAPPVTLAGTPLGQPRHACAFFSSDAEEYRVLLPFVKDGLERGERAVHVVGARDDHLRRLEAAGIGAAAGERVVVEDVIEFEARVDGLWCRHDDAVICTYRLGQLGGAALVDILRTHPLVIVGGTLQRDPYFVPPDRFLPEFRERRAKRRAHG